MIRPNFLTIEQLTKNGLNTNEIFDSIRQRDAYIAELEQIKLKWELEQKFKLAKAFIFENDFVDIWEGIGNELTKTLSFSLGANHYVLTALINGENIQYEIKYLNKNSVLGIGSFDALIETIVKLNNN